MIGGQGWVGGCRVRGDKVRRRLQVDGTGPLTIGRIAALIINRIIPKETLSFHPS
jgi:hypothetical protein